MNVLLRENPLAIATILASGLLPGVAGAVGAPLTAATHFPCAAQASNERCVQAAIAAAWQVDSADLSVSNITTTSEPDEPRAAAVKLLTRMPSARVVALLSDSNDGETLHTFRVALYRQILVWTRTSPAGDVASNAGPQLHRVDVVASPFAQTADANASGFIDELPIARLRRGVHAGDVVRREDLLLPGDIRNGDRVQFRVQQDGIAVSGPARALEDGRRGQALRLLPAHARQPIVAIALEQP